jgi:hypothetical protein
MSARSSLFDKFSHRLGLDPMLQNFFCLQFTDFRNKLERLSLASIASPFLCYYPRVEHLKGASFMYSPALPPNIRLG